MKELIRKILREGILDEELIQENYATNKELEKLAVEILTQWTMIWQRNNEVDFGFDVYIRDTAKPYEYEILGEFIEKTRINVAFTTDLHQNTKGQFSHQITNNTHGTIYLNAADKLEYIEGKIAEYNAKESNTEEDFYFLRYWCTSHFESTLVHELTHAYDNWRSNGNFANDSNKLDYRLKQWKTKQIYKKNREELTDKDYEALANHNRAYLRLDFEVNARFSQAVRDMRVGETDWDHPEFEDKLKPWAQYYKEFKQAFHGWDQMNVKIRKNLIRRLAKVYKDSADEMLSKQNKG